MKHDSLPPYLRNAVDVLGFDTVRKTLESAIAGERMVEKFLAGQRPRKRKPAADFDKNDVVGFIQYLTVARDKFDFVLGAAIGAGCVLRADRKRQAAVEQYLRDVLAGAVGQLERRARRS